VAEDELARFRELVRRRLQHEPVQYIVGTTEFYGLEFTVSPHVLIPRPETEHLVEAVIDRLKAGDATEPRILDIGTGSGVIAVTLAAQLATAQLTATDVSTDALAVAAANAESNGVGDRVTFFPHDILSGNPEAIGGPFDVVVSNPPYIATADMAELQEEIRAHEPIAALTDGGDGLAFYRRFASLLPTLLAPGGLLAVEIGYGQSEVVRGILADAGLRDIEVVRDYSGIDRVVLGRMTDDK
jgi:release factor glutamine methyltransferase